MFKLISDIIGEVHVIGDGADEWKNKETRLIGGIPVIFDPKVNEPVPNLESNHFILPCNTDRQSYEIYISILFQNAVIIINGIRYDCDHCDEKLRVSKLDSVPEETK